MRIAVGLDAFQMDAVFDEGDDHGAPWAMEPEGTSVGTAGPWPFVTSAVSW